MRDAGHRAEEAANRVIGAVIEVHKEIGAGLLERLNREGMCEELRRRGIPFEREVRIPVE